jgi:hypothetical protein
MPINDNKCRICEREFNTKQGRYPVGKPTKHHVVPKHKYHGRWRDAEVILICNFCHRQINKFFTNNELKLMTLEQLRNHQKVYNWIKWIRK